MIASRICYELSMFSDCLNAQSAGATPPGMPPDGQYFIALDVVELLGYQPSTPFVSLKEWASKVGAVNFGVGVGGGESVMLFNGQCSLKDDACQP